MSDKNFVIKSEQNKKSQKRAYIVKSVIGCVCLVFAVAFFTFLGFYFGNKETLAKPVSQVQNVQNSEKPVIDWTEVSTLEMRGMWIASVSNLNYPSKQNLSEEQLKAELDAIVEKAFELKVNTLFFQVRPCADALYNSEIFPASAYVSGQQGKTVSDFDSLSYLLSKAGEYNIDIHAWVNPFRVTSSASELDKLAENNIAKTHPEYTVLYADGKTYLNPGIPEVRELVVSGVRELCEKYPSLSGIHYDDYFYPYPSGNAEFDDAQAYELYGNGLDLADWRRENVNTVVRESYETVKEINPDCDFGVSVFGIWANKGSDTPIEGSDTTGLEAYNSLYCDAIAWAKDGYVDYIAPQNYWSINNSAAPFDDVARWWNANLDGTGVDLYFGHAAYKAGEFLKREIYRQVEMCRTLSCYKGSIFYGYEDITKNTGGVADDIKQLCSEKIVRKTPVTENKDIKINYPTNNSYINTTKTYVIGSCDPAYPLTLNGKPVSKTTGGYFGVFLELNKGTNDFKFEQNGKVNTLSLKHGVTNSTGSGGTATHKTLDKMEISSPYPKNLTWLDEKEELTVSCVAPAGSVVTVSLGQTSVVLSPTIYPPANSKYMYEKYTGKIMPSVDVADDEIKNLGVLKFKAILGNESATLEGPSISIKGTDAYSYAEIKEDYTHTKVGTSTSFYDDFLPSSKGMRDYITDMTNGYCKLRFGGYVASDSVDIVYGKPLLLNTILTTAVEVNAKDTSNNRNNSTDIRFGVTENIPVDVDFKGENGAMRIIIYNTDTSIIPQFVVPKNPLIKSIKGYKGTRENMLMYDVTLKDKQVFYGFNIVYENGCMIVKLNNPQTLADGDKPLSGKRIVVDAGHGGTDIGAPGPGSSPESVLNQAIATELVKKLENLGAVVIQSRKENNTVDLYERMDILNAECPDLAVSIHHNSVAGNSNALKAKGFLALYSNNSGVSLARTLSSVVSQKLGRVEKPYAYQQLAVARNHRFPSALLEMCFISNVEEYQWSISEGNFEKSAQAVADGIIKYYEDQEKYLEY